MKTFVATIGWTEWPIASAIIKHGLSNGDKIILLCPEKKDERAKEAINEIKDFISKFSSDVEIVDVSVPVYDPVSAVVTIARVIKDEAESDRDLIVNLSGGMRILIIETLLALMLFKIDKLDLEIRTEDKVDLSIPKIWKYYPDLAKEEVKVLKVLAEKEASLSEVSKKLGTSNATTYRILKRMEEDDLISSRKSGKERIVRLAPKGIVFFKLLCEKANYNCSAVSTL